MDAMHRLVDDLRVLRTSWEQEPFVSTGLGDFDDVFSVDSVDRLVHSSLPLAAVRLFRKGEPLPAEAFARRRERDGRIRQNLTDGDKVARYVAGGATLAIDELELYSPEVASFAAAVARETGYRTNGSAFLTPARARGLVPHHDNTSVFLRQVHGSKRWRVGVPARRWPSETWPRKQVDLGDPVLDVVLKEGDCLYIPRGFVHAGETTDEASAHLSIGLRPTPWAELLCGLLGAAAEETDQLREAMPPSFSALDRGELFRERRAVLSALLAELEWSPSYADTVPAEPVPRRHSLTSALDSSS
jgi:hypothetical protein